MKQISVESYSKLQENMFLMPGFFVQTRTLRKYPYSTASHLLGYVGEVNERLLKKNPYYKEGDYFIGRTQYDSPDVDNEVLVRAEESYIRIGDFLNVKIEKVDHFDLYGVVVD